MILFKDDWHLDSLSAWPTRSAASLIQAERQKKKEGKAGLMQPVSSWKEYTGFKVHWRVASFGP